MAKRDIIVVGASAGGVKALTEFTRSLPRDFTGSIFVVLHISAHSPSNLPAILTRAGFLKAQHPRDGERIKPGVIYVAPPDHHMLLEGKEILIKKGPKENRFRPSIDALFRSAAYVYGARVVGIILSGLLNDGTSGLWSVKRMGGLGIIQTPQDAEYPSMPVNALEYVQADYTVPAADMGSLLSNVLLQKAKRNPAIRKRERALMKMEVTIAKRDNAFEMGIMEIGELTPFTCPECYGVLVRLMEGKIVRFRCHTGHAFTASALLAELTTSVEEKMWQAMRGLEETTMLLKQIGAHFQGQGHPDLAKIFTDKSKMTARKAQIIHDSVFTQELLSEDIRHEKAKPSRRKKGV
jgi:two-component system, chemotaxis family, protein-glutamate methylesterase/glutaminase